ncbi:MAG: BlaI/MecI/CopY family transcriptional regulator, partial [Longimicrobiales bacterium]
MTQPPRPLDEVPSKREQQVLEVLHRLGDATVADIHEALPDAASYNAVRGTLRVLESKGWVEHERVGRRYRYRATASRVRAGRLELL